MENSTQVNLKKGRARRFENLLKAELRGGLPREIVTSLNPKLAEYLALLAEDGQEITLARAVNLAQIIKALQGDLKAYETIRDTIGEKPGGDSGTGGMAGGIKIVVEDAGNS